MNIKYENNIIPCVVSSKQIVSINKSGIQFDNYYIDFKVCSENFNKYYPDIKNCVGCRNINYNSFYFFTNPITHLFISNNNSLFNKIKKEHIKTFHEIQFKINDYGWCTYDLS